LHLFGDEQTVYTAEIRDDGSVGATRAYRGQDGTVVPVQDFAAAFAKRVRTLGGRLLVSEPDATGGVNLRLYDVAAGQDVWKRAYPGGSVVLKSENPALVAVAEPTGQVTVVDVLARRELLKADVGSTYVANIYEGLVLQDADDFYVALSTPVQQAVPGGLGMGPQLNFIGLRHHRVNGHVFAFEKATGELHWREAVPNQMLLLDGFEDLPMVLFSASYIRPVDPQKPNGAITRVTGTKTIDKTTGKLVYRREVQGQRPMLQYHTLKIDRRTGTFDLVGEAGSLRHYYDTAPAAAASSEP
jgi:hypothetical protein